MKHIEVYYAWEGIPSRRLSLEEGLGENEWNVYIEDWNDELNDYEQVDIGFFETYDEAEKSLEEQCDILEGKGFVRTTLYRVMSHN